MKRKITNQINDRCTNAMNTVAHILTEPLTPDERCFVLAQVLYHAMYFANKTKPKNIVIIIDGDDTRIHQDIENIIEPECINTH